MPTISGVTKDASGALCSAVIDVHRRDNGALVARTVSDTDGSYAVFTDDYSPHVVTRYVAPVIAGDPNWLSVSFAVQFGTAIDDLKNHTVTSVGGAALSSEQSAYGTQALSLNGSTAHLTVPASTDFDCGTGDFTARCRFFYKGSGNAYPLLFGNAVAWAPGTLTLNVDHSSAVNKLALVAYDTSPQTIASTTDVTLDAWHDAEVARHGTSLLLFLDGNLETSLTIPAGTTFNWGAGGMNIGGGTGGTDSCFYGYIQEIELYKGAAVHIESFTPSTAPFLTAPSLGSPTSNAQIFDNVIPGTVVPPPA